MTSDSKIERITTEAELDAAFAASETQPVWIFKHSLTCPISDAGWREFQRYVESEEREVLFRLVEIQPSRPLSKAVAERTGVRHESPQALLVRQGTVSWHESHWSIQSAALTAALG